MTMEIAPAEVAFLEGWEAREADARRRDNPHAINQVAADAWNAGWEASDRALRSAAED